MRLGSRKRTRQHGLAQVSGQRREMIEAAVRLRQVRQFGGGDEPPAPGPRGDRRVANSFGDAQESSVFNNRSRAVDGSQIAGHLACRTCARVAGQPIGGDGQGLVAQGTPTHVVVG